MRRGCLLTALVVLATTGAAQAATPRPVCHLVRDAVGDTKAFGVGPAGAPTDDLVGGDIASDGKVLTAVVRLAAVDLLDTSSPLGHVFTVQFAPRGAASIEYLSAEVGRAGIRYTFGTVTPVGGLVPRQEQLGTTTGFVDETRREVRIHLVLSRLPEKVRKGTVIERIFLSSSRVVLPATDATPNYAASYDYTTDEQRYVVGTRSCVRPGR